MESHNTDLGATATAAAATAATAAAAAMATATATAAATSHSTVECTVPMGTTGKNCKCQNNIDKMNFIV